MSYLDYNGLSYFLSKLRTFFAAKEDVDAVESGIADNHELSTLVTTSANLAPWRFVDVFRTYIEHNSEFKYGAGSFLGMTYDESTGTYRPTTVNGIMEDGVPKFYASCSTAATAAIMGIPYESSRMNTGTKDTTGSVPQLVGGTNTPVSGGMLLDVYNQKVRNKYAQNPTIGYLYSSNMAHWFYDIGLLHEIKDTGDLSQLAAGDIVFWVQHGEEEEDVYWRGIGHVGIYLGPWYTGCHIAEITNEEPIWKFRTRSGASLANLKYYARIPASSNLVPKNVIADRFPLSQYPDGYSYRNVSGLGAGHAIKFDDSAKFKMEPNSVYTVIMQLKNISGTNVRVAVNGYSYDDTNSAYSAIVGSIMPSNNMSYLGNDTYWGTVVTPNESTFPNVVIDGLYFRPNADSSTYSIDITNIQFYDRLIQPSALYDIYTS